MLVIRLRRVGRKGLAQYRVVVQDSRWSAKSGKFVTQLGSFDPHAKKLQIDKEKAAKYLQNGAQPSERIVLLFKKEGIKLPGWVPKPAKKQGKPRAKKEGGEGAEGAVAAPATEAAPKTDAPAEQLEDKPQPAEASAEPEEQKTEETPAEEQSVEAEKPAEPES